MNKWMFLALALSPSAFAVDMDKSCSSQECNVGDALLTYAVKSDPYYACPTRELSEYVNGVMGLVSITYSMTGKFPNVSPATGEPEFQGETKTLIDIWRSDAGVRTLDEASEKCRDGKNKVQVTLMNTPDEGISVWVVDQKKSAFWLPRGHLFKR